MALKLEGRKAGHIDLSQAARSEIRKEGEKLAAGRTRAGNLIKRLPNAMPETARVSRPPWLNLNRQWLRKD
jgi:hypothetical protein